MTKMVDGKYLPFKWSPEAQAAFDSLKEAFSSAELLRHHDPSLPFVLETDTSGFAMGAVLSQQFPDSMSRAPVSRAAKPAQRDSIRYGAREEGRVESTGSRV